MGIDFERTKRDIGIRSVVITSWFDDKSGSWRASAPGYPYVQNRVPTAGESHGSSPSRNHAIDRVLNQLRAYFALPEVASTGHVPFL